MATKKPAAKKTAPKKPKVQPTSEPKHVEITETTSVQVDTMAVPPPVSGKAIIERERELALENTIINSNIIKPKWFKR